MSLQRFAPLLLAAVFACDAEPDDDAPSELPIAGQVPASPTPERLAPAKAPPAPVAGPVMPNARAAFARTLELIDKEYVDREISEDALYTGALQGMLGRLIQLEGHPVNDLLSPDDLAELLSGTAGAIVGVGVHIGLRDGVLTVIHVIPDGPAAQAGIEAGDRILAIDGASVKGRELAEIVGQIRGQAGTEVDLFVQREADEWHRKLKRASVPVPNVESLILGDELGYLRLTGFAETTPAELDAAIEKLQAAGMRALVLDLRDCPGGLFEAAITITGRFLADGQTIVSLVDRDRIRTTRAAAGDGRWHELPLAVLVGPGTASGAELLADALRTHKRATLIGQPTLGKDTVESIHELGNGWAVKLSGSRFLGASDQPLQGRGVRPQLPVASPQEAPTGPLAQTLASDDAVAAARTWLEGQVR